MAVYSELSRAQLTLHALEMCGLFDGNGQTRSPEEIDRSFGVEGVTVVNTPYDDYSPSFTLRRYGVNLLVLCGGAQQFSHGNAIFQSLLRSTPDNNRRGAWSVYSYNAGLILAAIAGLGRTYDLVFMFGHSYGGAVLERLLLEYVSTGTSLGDRVYGASIGAPRTASYDGAASLADFVRYFRQDDPVPLIAPTADESPISHRLLTASRSRAWQICTNWTPGFQIDAEGNEVTRMYPAEAATNPAYTILDWIVRCMVGPTPNHSWQAYRPRMTTYLNRLINQRVPDSGRGNYVPAVQRGAANNSPAARAAEADLVGANVVGAGPRGQVLKDYLFTVQRTGEVYYVLFRGYPLMSTLKSKTARYAAAGGNRLVRSMLKAGQVSGNEWLRAFQSFLEDVSTDGTGFPRVVPLSSELTGSGFSLTF